MLAKRLVLSLLLGFALFLSGSLSVAAQAERSLPELLYTCPMHPDVLEKKTGSCAICKMPLEPVRMEAALKDDTRPLKLTLKVRLNTDTPESQFDFTFSELSKEPAPPPASTTTAARQARTPVSITTAGASGPQAPAAAGVPTLRNCEPNVARTDVLLLSDALPKDAKALLDLLSMCTAEVQKLIDSGQFGFVYQPTMLGKDIALALDDHVNALPDRRRLQATDGIRRAVLLAWQLDMYGDLGNQTKLAEAFKLFSAAIADIKSAYGTKP